MNKNHIKLKSFILLITLLISLSFSFKVYKENIKSFIEKESTVEDFSPNHPKRSVYYEDTNGSAIGIYISGDFAYVTDSLSGLVIFNISDPTDPGTPIYKATTGIALDVYVRGDYAYVADYSSGLAIIDISDPTNPGTPIYRATTGYALDVYVSGDYAYVADEMSGLAIIDVSDPTNPGTPIYQQIRGITYGVYVSGDYAFIANWYGLVIINISDPTNPGAPIYRSTYGIVRGVFVNENYAYVAVNSDYFHDISCLAIINISDPTNPGTPIYENTIGAPQHVYVNGDFAFVADWSGLTIINISDSNNPEPYFYKTTTGLVLDVYVRGIYCYIADWTSGLAVINLVDMIDPLIIISPNDLTLDYGYSGVNISWIATDTNPNLYTISLQGTGIVAGPSSWSNGTEVIYHVAEGLPSGEYYYTIKFTDDYDNYVTDTIKITIREEIKEVKKASISIGNCYLMFLIIGIISLAIFKKRSKHYKQV